MKTLRDLIGVERYLDQVSGALRHVVRELGPPVVGALEVTCSDESELECGESFQHEFVEHLLPPLKTGARSAFRTGNLGARYEIGSVAIAESHFATPASRDAFKVLVVKINGHVSVCQGPGGPEYGPMQRYEAESTACGALHALLAGQRLPALLELREAFGSGAIDRVAALLDPHRVPPAYRYVCAALVGARLQARRAEDDIRRHSPQTPTVYLVVPCVTFNRPGPDTELVVGFCQIDGRSGACAVRYEGLGDDPSRYRIERHGDRLRIADA